MRNVKFSYYCISMFCQNKDKNYSTDKDCTMRNDGIHFYWPSTFYIKCIFVGV